MEIAEQIELPPSLARQWFNRGYYGTMSHNSKAVYQRYMGWYDGNPANLNPLPPEQAGSRYVEAMGGADAALNIAQSAYDEAIIAGQHNSPITLYSTTLLTCLHASCWQKPSSRWLIRQKVCSGGICI